MDEITATEKTTSNGTGPSGAVGAILGAIAGSVLLYVLLGDRIDAGAAALEIPALGLAGAALIAAIVVSAIGGASTMRGGFVAGLLVPAAFFAAPAFAPAETNGKTNGSADREGDGAGSGTADPGPAGDDEATATIRRLEADLKIRDAELATARQHLDDAAAAGKALSDQTALARTELEEERKRSAELSATLEARQSMLKGSDEAVLRTRKELDESLERIATLQAKYGLERSKLMEKIEELEGPAAGFEAKIRTLEAAGYHACGVVMNVEKSRYGDRLAIRTSVDAARIASEGILRAPNGTILAVIDFVIGRDDTLSAKVLFTKKDARITIGDVVYSRLK
jgi:hypothetical protein